MSDLRAITLDGLEFYLDAHGDVVGYLAVSYDAHRRMEDALYGATWVPNDGNSPPEYDPTSEEARNQAAAAVRENLAFALVSGDHAYLQKITTAHAGLLLAPLIRCANRDPSEMSEADRQYNAECLREAEAFRRKLPDWTRGKLALAKHVTGLRGNDTAKKRVRYGLSLMTPDQSHLWKERADAGRERPKRILPNG